MFVLDYGTAQFQIAVQFGRFVAAYDRLATVENLGTPLSQATEDELISRLLKSSSQKERAGTSLYSTTCFL